MKNKKFLLFLNLILTTFFCFSSVACVRHTHVFDRKVATMQYCAFVSDCANPSQYYYSCSCNEIGEETFTVNDLKQHTYQIEKNFKCSYLTGEIPKGDDFLYRKYCTVCKQESYLPVTVKNATPLSSDTVIEISVDDKTLQVPVTVGAVAVDNVELVKEGEALLYKTTGYCSADLTVDTFGFDMVSENGVYVYVSKEDVSLTLTEAQNGIKNYVITANVSNLPANGLEFYSRLYVNGNATRLKWNSETWKTYSVENGTSIYEISIKEQANDLYAMPAVTRNSSSTVKDGAVYYANSEKSADIVERNGRVYYEIYGLSSGYTYEELSKYINFEMRIYDPSVTSSSRLVIKGVQNGPLLFEENGNFTLVADITDLAPKDTTPYYTRFGNVLPSGLICDFSGKDINAQDGKIIQLNDTVYELIYRRTGNMYTAYGTVGLFVRKVNL